MSAMAKSTNVDEPLETKQKVGGLRLVQPEDSDREPPAVEFKRLNINLPVPRYENLQRLSKRTGMSMTNLVRWGLGLVEGLVGDYESGHRIVIVDSQGNLVKEIVFPL